MKNITVTVPDDIYRLARIRAAQQGRSVSAMVTEFLTGLSEDDGFAHLQALQRSLQAQITDFTAADRLDRDQVHDRALR